MTSSLHFRLSQRHSNQTTMRILTAIILLSTRLWDATTDLSPQARVHTTQYLNYRTKNALSSTGEIPGISDSRQEWNFRRDNPIWAEETCHYWKLRRATRDWILLENGEGRLRGIPVSSILSIYEAN